MYTCTLSTSFFWAHAAIYNCIWSKFKKLFFYINFLQFFFYMVYKY